MGCYIIHNRENDKCCVGQSKDVYRKRNVKSPCRGQIGLLKGDRFRLRVTEIFNAYWRKIILREYDA